MGRDRLGGLTEPEIVKIIAGHFGLEQLDDAAPVTVSRGVFVSSDMMLQSTDLPTNTHPVFWGHRFVASNVSDMLAMGCKPADMMVSLGLPEDMKVLHFRKLLEGMSWAMREAGLKIIGGDTNRASELILSGFVTGVPFNEPFKRSGANPGDFLFITGSPGLAALGLAIIGSKEEKYFDSPDLLEEDLKGSARAIGAFLAPEIRITEAEDLSNMGVVTSCIDVSDGISTDAGHISEASDVRVIIEEERLPMTPEARGLCKLLKLNPLNLALDGGDDYELLFTAPPEAKRDIEEAEIATLIGEVAEGKGVFIRRRNGKVESLKSSGYQHFHGREI